MVFLLSGSMTWFGVFSLMVLMPNVLPRHFFSTKPSCYQPVQRKSDFGVKLSCLMKFLLFLLWLWITFTCLWFRFFFSSLYGWCHFITISLFRFPSFHCYIYFLALLRPVKTTLKAQSIYPVHSCFTSMLVNDATVLWLYVSSQNLSSSSWAS